MKSHNYTFGSKDTVLFVCGQSVSVVLRAEECSLAVRSTGITSCCRMKMQVNATADTESH